MILNKKGHVLVTICIIIGVFLLINPFLYLRAKEKLDIERGKIVAIAQVIASEGCSEGKIGLYLIANTIKNRSEQWNKTPYEIVTQSNQYYGLTSPNRIQLYNQCKDFSDELASKILELPDMTSGALYFRRPNEEKRMWHKTKTIRFKNHIFYK